MFPLSLMTSLQSHGKCMCGIFPMDMKYVVSSLVTVVMTDPYPGYGMVVTPTTYYSSICDVLSFCLRAQAMSPTNYDELPMKIWSRSGKGGNCTSMMMWRHDPRLLLLLKTNVLQCKNLHMSRLVPTFINQYLAYPTPTSFCFPSRNNWCHLQIWKYVNVGRGLFLHSPIYPTTIAWIICGRVH